MPQHKSLCPSTGNEAWWCKNCRKSYFINWCVYFAIQQRKSVSVSLSFTLIRFLFGGNSVVGLSSVIKVWSRIWQILVKISYPICFLFVETFWSLKYFGHLSQSCVKARQNSVFCLYFPTFWPKWLNFFRSFQKRFRLLPKNSRKKQIQIADISGYLVFILPG